MQKAEAQSKRAIEVFPTVANNHADAESEFTAGDALADGLAAGIGDAEVQSLFSNGGVHCASASGRGKGRDVPGALHLVR